MDLMRFIPRSRTTFIVILILLMTLRCYFLQDYCLSPNAGGRKVFCMGVEHHNFHFGPGQGCLSKSTCSIIVSGLVLYPNSSWFKVYIPIDKEATQIDVYFLITKHEVKFAKDSDVTKKLGVRDTMIAKGEVRSNGTISVYSYRIEKDKRRQDTKKLTSSSFCSFAPDRKQARMRQSFGYSNYTVFCWRTSEYLTEGAETFNYHRVPVRVTLRIALKTLASQNVVVVRSDRHMIFGDPIKQQVRGHMEFSTRQRDEL